LLRLEGAQLSRLAALLIAGVALLLLLEQQSLELSEPGVVPGNVGKLAGRMDSNILAPVHLLSRARLPAQLRRHVDARAVDGDASRDVAIT
jgi:hypothetical protein